MRPRSIAAIAITSAAFIVGSTHAMAAGSPAGSLGGMLAQATQAVPQSVILDMTLTKGGTNELKPSLRVPLGTQGAVEAAPGITVSVTQAQLNGKQLTLRIGVSESMPQGLMESLTTIDVPVDKPVKLQLGSDPSRDWLIEFTPQVTPAPPNGTS